MPNLFKLMRRGGPVHFSRNFWENHKTAAEIDAAAKKTNDFLDKLERKTREGVV
jgi:hypothetical protein